MAIALASGRTINVGDIIENSPLGSRRLIIFCVIFCFILIEGYDTAALAFVVPTLVNQLGMSTTDVSWLFGAGMGGLMISSWGGGVLSDRFGRKKVSLISVFLFSLACLGVAYSSSFHELFIWRLLTGIGIGAALPSLTTLSAELSPSDGRSTIIAAVNSGFITGQVAAGFTTAFFLNTIGWQGVMLIGGIAPLLMVVILAAFMPESPRYLALKPGNSEKVAKSMSTLFPHMNFQGTTFTSNESARNKSSVRELFSSDYRFATICLWAMNLCILMCFYTLASWLTQFLANEAGYPSAEASKLATWLQIGTLAGSVVTSIVLRKVHPVTWIAIAITIGIGLPFLLSSQTDSPQFIVYAAVTGFFVAGPMVGLNALTASYYPTYIRGAGVGWAAVLSRLGSLFGATVVGVLVSKGMTIAQVFEWLAVPLTVAALCAWLLRTRLNSTSPESAADLGGH